MNARDLAALVGVKPKGMGSILSTIDAGTHRIGLPNAFKREKLIEGGDRVTYVIASAAMVAAAKEAGVGP